MGRPGRPRVKKYITKTFNLSEDVLSLIYEYGDKYNIPYKRIVEEAVLSAFKGANSRVLSLTADLENAKQEIKELTAELDKLKRENERLERKLQKLEGEDVEDEDSHLSPKQRRIKNILKKLEKYVGRRYEEAMFEIGISENELKEILWDYFKEDAKPASWLLTGLADVVIDVRDEVRSGWFGTGIIRPRSEYEAWAQEREREREERRLRLGLPAGISGGAAVVEVRK